MLQKQLKSIQEPLQQVLTGKCPHLQFWVEAMRKLMDMRYVKQKCKSPLTNPPSLNGWIENLTTLPVIWKMLKEKEFTFTKTGLINQDSLENFFGSLKSRRVRYVSPSCHQTEGLYKALLVSSLLIFTVLQISFPLFDKRYIYIKIF